MTVKKRGSAFFEAEKFIQGLTELIDALPSDADRQQVVAQLEILIRFLSDLKARLESIPTRQDAATIQMAVDELKSLFVEAKSNPILGAALGIKATAPRQKPAAITSEEMEHAKSVIAQFDSMPIDELRKALDRMSLRDLKSVANAIGVRVTQGTARETLLHQVATKISNTRGYRSLREGAN